MIERYLFVKLPAPQATAEGRAHLRAEVERHLGATGVRLGAPADAKAEAAWDLAIVLPRPDPAGLAEFEAWLAGRAEVVKAWSFEVS